MTKVLETLYDQLSLLLLTSPEELPAFREEEAEAMRQLKKIIGDVESKMQGQEDREVAELLRYMRQVVLGEVEKEEERLPPSLRDILV
jgi:Sec-independent protein translocase protein TatA